MLEKLQGKNLEKIPFVLNRKVDMQGSSFFISWIEALLFYSLLVRNCLEKGGLLEIKGIENNCLVTHNELMQEACKC